MKRDLFQVFAGWILIAVLLVGCDVAQTNYDEPGSLQVTMSTTTAPSMSKQSANILSESLQIDEIKLFISDLHLYNRTDSVHMRTKNFIINLPTNGEPLILSEMDVEEGRFDRLRFHIKNNTTHNRSVSVTDPDFSDGRKQYSVVVKGVYNGQEFMFRSDKVYNIDFRFSPAFVVSASGNNRLNISVDTDSWFVHRVFGTELDPTSNRDAKWIEQNIRNSFKTLNAQPVEEDDDSSGENGDGDDNGQDGDNGDGDDNGQDGDNGDGDDNGQDGENGDSDDDDDDDESDESDDTEEDEDDDDSQNDD